MKTSFINLETLFFSLFNTKEKCYNDFCEFQGDSRRNSQAKPKVLVLARWLSWLEHRPVTAGVMGSNPIRVVKVTPLYVRGHF